MKTTLIPVWGALLLCSGIAAQPAPQAGETFEQKIQRAMTLLKSGHADEGKSLLQDSLGDLEAAVKKEPNNHKGHFLLGQVYLYLGRSKPAAAELDRAIALAPKEPEYHVGKGLLLERQNPAAAEKEFIAATQLAPNSGRYWFELGDMLARHKKNDPALDAYRKACDLDPKDVKARLKAGAFLAETGKDAEAEERFKQVTVLAPKYAGGWYNLGEVCQKQAKYDQALEAFQAADKLLPDDFQVRAEIMQCYEALKRPAERDAQREAILELYKAGKVKEPSFCRDQFLVGKDKVMVFETFEMKSDRPIRYTFNVVDPATTKLRYRVSLASYDATARASASGGPPAGDPHPFHLDADFPAGEHRGYATFKSEPTYEQTKQQVIAILQGKLKPATTTKPPRPAKQQVR